MRYRIRYRMQCDIACDKKDIASVKNPDEVSEETNLSKCRWRPRFPQRRCQAARDEQGDLLKKKFTRPGGYSCYRDYSTGRGLPLPSHRLMECAEPELGCCFYYPTGCCLPPSSAPPRGGRGAGAGLLLILPFGAGLLLILPYW